MSEKLNKNNAFNLFLMFKNFIFELHFSGNKKLSANIDYY